MSSSPPRSEADRDAGPAIDVAASRIVVHTQATGLLARFAHDLEIAASRFEGSLERADGRWQATLRFPVGALRTVGVLRHGRVDDTVLSASDRDEIHQRIQEQVFGRTTAIRVRAEGPERERGSATVELDTGCQTIELRHHVSERAAGLLVVEGRCELRLSALGIREIKGPLGAFRVHDGVAVIYSVAVRTGGSA